MNKLNVKNTISLLLVFIFILLPSACANDQSETTSPLYSPPSPVNPLPSISNPPPATASPLPSNAITPEKPQATSPEITGESHYKEAVIKADYIVTGTISDKKYEVVTRGTGETAGKSAYTIYTLKVDKVIKGNPNTKELFVKTLGGKIDENISEIVVEEIVFEIPSEVLLCLSNKDIYNNYNIKEDDTNTYFIMQGPIWVYSETRHSYPDVEVVIGWLIKDMRDNNIPISLPDKDIPPIPTHFDIPKGTQLRQ